MSHKRKIDCRKSCNIVLDVNSRSLKYCFFWNLTCVHFTFMVRNSLEIVQISPLFSSIKLIYGQERRLSWHIGRSTAFLFNIRGS